MENQNLDELHSQKEVSPAEELEKALSSDQNGTAPKLTGTGSNNPVQREESLIIKKDKESADSKNSDS